ncbi:MAG: hypothetical protein J6T26_06605 [Firmicutes bacterium]|nr:hypothetical protein [Bacillota bacterium]
MISFTRSMRNNSFRAARTGASCDTMNKGLLDGRALSVRLFVLFLADIVLSLWLSLLISRSKFLPLRIS